jgi:hypothetical protein
MTTAPTRSAFHIAAFLAAFLGCSLAAASISAQPPLPPMDSGTANPNTLEEAFRALDQEWSAEERHDFKRKSEIHAVADVDFNVVVFIRQWFRPQHAPLRDDLKARGIRHPDYAYVVLGAYWQHLNGKPIQIEKYLAGGPNTLDEAFCELDQLLPADLKEIFMNKPEEKAVMDADFGLRMFISNQWLRTGRSTLPGYFASLRVASPETMSRIVLSSYWRYLNRWPIELEKRFACHEVPACWQEWLREERERTIAWEKDRANRIRP